MPSVYDLKPRFQAMLRPTVRQLAVSAERIGQVVNLIQDIADYSVLKLTGAARPLLRGEEKLTGQEELGRLLFFSQQFTNCNICHQLKPTPAREGETFSSYEYHNIGVPPNTAVPRDLRLSAPAPEAASRCCGRPAPRRA